MKFFAWILLFIILPKYVRASVVVLNGLTHIHTLPAPDGKTQGTVKVKNEGIKDARIIIYRQDLVSDCGKPSSYPDPNSHKYSLGDGLRTNVDEKILSANEEYEIRYNIELEMDKSSPGSYWEVIMVEVADPVRDELKNGVQVNSKVRYAIQVIVDVGDYEGPKLSFESIFLDKPPGQEQILKVQLKNNSSFGSRANVVLEIYDAQGNKLKTTEPNTRMLYPGYCNTFEVPISKLPAGKYDCVIIADTGKDLFGSNISVQVE
ncbi:hypothetical protein SAMN04487995_1845 [Dyadobacter koreensis]|uniref:DUF3324 domain-containing protein n=1 Tax=Dyadobacter koreensis TaxID=408657 RepID=A0A1H6T725_9BACT|nr:hypothetical protein [Dyadobacter koreensis]SEI71622.1 hypothetical protein SAMN04487995_1845 [Dyadobacter koreensis]